MLPPFHTHRSIPDSGFYVGQEFVPPFSAAFNATPEDFYKGLLRPVSYYGNNGWSVQALAVQPATRRKDSRATWYAQPRAPNAKSTTVASGRTPGLFAPVGSDFVIGCDYMEVGTWSAPAHQPPCCTRKIERSPNVCFWHTIRVMAAADNA